MHRGVVFVGRCETCADTDIENWKPARVLLWDLVRFVLKFFISRAMLCADCDDRGALRCRIAMLEQGGRETVLAGELAVSRARFANSAFRVSSPKGRVVARNLNSNCVRCRRETIQPD